MSSKEFQWSCQALAPENHDLLLATMIEIASGKTKGYSAQDYAKKTLTDMNNTIKAHMTKTANNRVYRKYDWCFIMLVFPIIFLSGSSDVYWAEILGSGENVGDLHVVLLTVVTCLFLLSLDYLACISFRNFRAKYLTKGK